MSIPISPPDPALVYSVSRLNREVRLLLESGLSLIWVEGEVSNFSRPSSGHWYFSLKDDAAQVRCAMFRTKNSALPFQPQNGMKVLARIRATLYEPRGDYQLLVEYMEPAGEGALRAAFERLKAKLQAEGLFAEASKKSLPVWPRCVGVVTSPTGAAIRDILHVLNRRFPAIKVIIYPVPVQGADAAAKIVQAVRVAGERKECDVLIIARGGGSLEDMAAFNEETVAREIYRCPLPTVSGVGHEIDFSIADFVADCRAPTPSAAAELVAPDASAVQTQFKRLLARMAASQEQSLKGSRKQLTTLVHRLQRCHPEQRLRNQAQRLDELDRRLARAAKAGVSRERHNLSALASRLNVLTPVHRLNLLQQRLQRDEERLDAAVLMRIDMNRRRLTLASRGLATVSPLATLDRGYAIAHRCSDGQIIRRAKEVERGDAINVRLAQGELICEVTLVQ